MTSLRGRSRHADGDSLGLLAGAPFLSYVDRFAIPPMLLAVSRDIDRSLAAVSLLATLYFFTYGLTQLFWGLMSDRLGRVRVMRLALVGLAATNVLAAVAPALPALIVSKAAAGAFAAALLPVSLVYVADRVPFPRRQQAITTIMSAGAMGTVIGTLGSGLLSSLASWRLVFLLTVPLALGLALALGQLPEAQLQRSAGGALEQVRCVLSQRWARFLLSVAVLEGAVVLGFLTFLAPALVAHGESAARAGVVVAAYGGAVLLASQAVKQAVRREALPANVLIVAGGCILFVAYLVAAAGQAVPNILASSVLSGAGFAMLHSTLQTWATELVPEARGTATALFVTAVFTGAAVGSGAVSGLAGTGRFSALFLVAATATLAVTALAAGGHRRFIASRAAG